MTKADLIDAIYGRVGFSKQESARAVEMILEFMTERLAHGEPVKISGFGKFAIREKPSRVGRNPQTGEEIEITARRVLTFKASQVLREAVGESVVRTEENGEEKP